MLYIYAILPTPFQLTRPLFGLADQPLQCFKLGQLVAIAEPGVDISALRLLPESALLEKVLKHDQIIASLFGDCPLLPMRFGIAFVSESALYQYLQENGQHLRDRLEFLAGKAEYSLELTPTMPIPENISAKDGKSYLLAKKQQYAQQKSWSDRLQVESRDWQNRLEQYCTHWSIPYQVATTTDLRIKCHLLLTEKQYAELSEYLAGLINTDSAVPPHWQWQFSLPLPPYHFV